LKEKDYAGEIAKSFRELWPAAFYTKIPDAQISPTLRAQGIGAPIARPFDAFAVSNGLFCALEYKIHKALTGFALDHIRPIQRLSLAKVENNGCAAGIVINIRVKREVVKKRYASAKSGYNSTLVIPYHHWAVYEEYKRQCNSKSIPFKDMISANIPGAWVCPRVKLPNKTYGWDVENMFKYLTTGIMPAPAQPNLFT